MPGSIYATAGFYPTQGVGESSIEFLTRQHGFKQYLSRASSGSDSSPELSWRTPSIELVPVNRSTREALRSLKIQNGEPGADSFPISNVAGTFPLKSAGGAIKSVAAKKARNSVASESPPVAKRASLLRKFFNSLALLFTCFVPCKK